MELNSYEIDVYIVLMVAVGQDEQLGNILHLMGFRFFSDNADISNNDMHLI